MKTTTLKLTITVEYTLNGASIDELKENLAAGAEYLAGIGKFTQDTEAEVETWEESVEKVDLDTPPKMEQALLDIHAYATSRDGQPYTDEYALQSIAEIANEALKA